MNFELTEDQRLVQRAAHDFAAREVVPKASELDRTGRFPAELVTRMGELGFMGLTIPAAHGGAGLDNVSYALVVEEVSRACASCGAIMRVNNALFCDPLSRFGSEQQKREILRPTASGSMLGASGLTEPASGSNAPTVRAAAERSGDGGFLLNGSKGFVTVGPEAEHILVLAATAPHPENPGYTALIVRRGTPGLTLSPRDEKLGIRAAHAGTLFFENVRVPREHVLGHEGAGSEIAMSAIDGGRIGVAAQAIGIARAAYEAAIAYAKERTSHNKPLAEHQAIQLMIADMATEIDAARLLTLRAAKLRDRGVQHTVESSVAKLFASEMSTRVTHKALQIHGEHGYTTEFDVERHYRDARITELHEGTSEIQRVVIASGVIKS